MLEEPESVGSVLSRAYQRVVDRLNTPSAPVPTESVQLQNVPQMTAMGTQSEYGAVNVFQQTSGGKNVLRKYKPEYFAQGENQGNSR